MNRVGHNKLYMTIGLSVLLLVQAVLFVILKGSFDGMVFLVFSLVVLLALLAVFSSYRNVMKLKSKIADLPKDYQDVYINAQEAVGLSSISLSAKKDINNQLVEIFSHAAIEKREVNEVIGNNLKEFLEPFLEAAGSKEDLVYYLIYGAWLYSIYLLFFKMYKVVRIGFNIDNFVTEKMDVGIVLTYGLIAFVFFPWLMLIMKKSSKEQWTGIKKIWVILPFMIPLGLFGMLVLIGNSALREFLDTPLHVFPSFIAFGIGIAISIALYLMMKWYIKRN